MSKNKNLNGHYEEKTVFIIPWGLMVCLAAFAVGPYFIGSGFLFLICPAQVASLEQGQAQIQETPKKQTFVEKIQAKQTTQNIKVA